MHSTATDNYQHSDKSTVSSPMLSTVLVATCMSRKPMVRHAGLPVNIARPLL